MVVEIFLLHFTFGKIGRQYILCYTSQRIFHALPGEADRLLMLNSAAEALALHTPQLPYLSLTISHSWLITQYTKREVTSQCFFLDCDLNKSVINVTKISFWSIFSWKKYQLLNEVLWAVSRQQACDVILTQYVAEENFLCWSKDFTVFCCCCCWVFFDIVSLVCFCHFASISQDPDFCGSGLVPVSHVPSVICGPDCSPLRERSSGLIPWGAITVISLPYRADWYNVCIPPALQAALARRIQGAEGLGQPNPSLNTPRPPKKTLSPAFAGSRYREL